jgi:hypothetical protein
MGGVMVSVLASRAVDRGYIQTCSHHDIAEKLLKVTINPNNPI